MSVAETNLELGETAKAEASYEVLLSQNKSRAGGCSLASHCHTLQCQEKEGLVISHTTSCSGDRIWLRPIRFEILNLLLSNALLAARAHKDGPVWFAVTRDVFAFRQNNSLYARLPDPLSLEIEGCG